MAAEQFLSAVKALTERGLGIADLIGAAEGLQAQNQTQLAVDLYRLWIKCNHDSPLLYAANFNLGTLLTGLGDTAGARAAFEASLASRADFFPASVNLGGALERLGDVEQAIAAWAAIATQLENITGPNVGFKTTAFKQIGRVLEARGRLSEAEAVLQQGLLIDPRQPEVIQHYIATRLAQCKWPVAQPFEGVDRSTLIKGMSPLSSTIYADDPVLHLGVACSYNRTWDPEQLPQLPKPAGKAPNRLRVGYVSSDLREHAIGYLMAELFELHDRKKIEVFAYYCGQASEDHMNARIRGAVEHWVDISKLDDKAAAERIAADGIQILVDVNGYTRDARTAVFAMRPAPVQVNWLGFPGTMGSPYHHYILADDWIIRPEDELYYTEKVLRLPCYQPNDRRRLIAPVAPTRAEAGLPESATVFCCFNGSQKISAPQFQRWMGTLTGVPGSVLWLLDGPDATNKRLVELAEQHGVAAERLVFAPKLANPYHLARYPLADLFLDTAPYGAHTTASDALWMGVPVLTFSGRSFASRVCGSLVRAAGLPELVCGSAEEYVERAVALGRDRPQLARCKEILAERRDTCVLFDMGGHVAQLEALFGHMWSDYQNGRLPRPDLTNADAYLDVAAAMDHDGDQASPDPNYPAGHRRALAERHRIRPIGADSRLWTAADIAVAEGGKKQKVPA